MSRPELRRLGAAGCLLAALSSQQIGYAAGALDDSPLVAGMVMVSAGAGVLAVSVHWRGGGFERGGSTAPRGGWSPAWRSASA